MCVGGTVSGYIQIIGAGKQNRDGFFLFRVPVTAVPLIAEKSSVRIADDPVFLFQAVKDKTQSLACNAKLPRIVAFRRKLGAGIEFFLKLPAQYFVNLILFGRISHFFEPFNVYQ